jgi:hypothetical protein
VILTLSSEKKLEKALKLIEFSKEEFRIRYKLAEKN